jgi:hypothetical protein
VTSTGARTIRAVAKRWSIATTVLGIVLAVLVRQGVAGLVAVPGRDGIDALVWPMAGAIPAMVIAGAAGALHEDPERLARRPAVHQRIAYVVLVVALVSTGAALGGPPAWRMMCVRNDLGLTGLGLGSAAVLGRTSAWLPPAVLAVVTWFFGPGPAGTVAGWAVLLRPAGQHVPDVVCTALAITGTMLFLCGLPRSMRATQTRG